MEKQRKVKSFKIGYLIKISIIMLGALLIISYAALMIGPTDLELEAMLQLRLPRIILAIIVGGGLGMVGGVFQGLLRNPLADPYFLGVSTGGGLGAALGIFIGSFFVWVSSFLIPIFAFFGSAGTIFLVYYLARFRGIIPRDTLILAGVIVSAFFWSIIMLLLTFAGKELHEITNVLLGNLSMILTERNLYLLIFVSAMVVLGTLVILSYCRELNILSVGEESAQHLGVDIERVKKILFISASFVTGAVVSVSGLIGFVGLVVPHIVRMSLGPDHRILIPTSIFGGSMLLVISDTIARTVMYQEIPIGVVTSFFGAPFFIYLLRTRKKGWF